MAYNTPAVMEAVQKAFNIHPNQNSIKMELDPSVEDFSVLATAKKISYVYWNIRGTDPDE